MEFCEFKKYKNSYYSKNHMWIIDNCPSVCQVYLRTSEKQEVKVASYDKSIYGDKAFQKCIDYVNRVCKEEK